MKKLISILLILCLSTNLSACCCFSLPEVIEQSLTAKTPDTVMPAPTNSPAPTLAPETTPFFDPSDIFVEPETTETEYEESTMLPLSEETVSFYFSSGAGGWGTELVLNRNGTFTGEYHDSEMGDVGEGYPYGTVYICSFTGSFTAIEKISDNAYKMLLNDILTDIPVGETWISNDIRYIASTPYGIDGGTEFILYLPETPVSEVSEDFLWWWPLRYEQDTNPTSVLSLYGILNVATGDGFFSY